MTILLSTHSLDVAEEVSDRLAIIHRGTLVTQGTLQEIRTQTGNMKSDLEEIFLQLTAQAYDQSPHQSSLQSSGRQMGDQ